MKNCYFFFELSFLFYQQLIFLRRVVPFYFLLYNTNISMKYLKGDIYMNIAKQIPIMTLEEYEATPEDERMEVFEGIPYAMAGASTVHQRLSSELLYLIKDYIRKNNGTCEVFHPPFDVKLDDNLLTIVQPDLMVVCDPSKLDKNRCNGAPDFIIEIVSSSNPTHDYIKKLYYYEHYGVKEYWIVDPEKQIITVYNFEKNICNDRYSFHDKIKVGIYDDLYIDFAPLLKLL